MRPSRASMGAKNGRHRGESGLWRGLTRLALAAGVATSTALIAATAGAESATLAPTRDTSLFEGLDNNSNGAGSDLFAGMTGSQAGNTLRRALLGFDVTEVLPAGASIQAVSLTLRANKTAPGASATGFALHRVTSDWGEGSSNSFRGGEGAQATLGDATWAYSSFVPAPGTSAPWTTAGGDFEVAASGTQTISGPGSYTFSGPGLVEDVQHWVDSPQEDFGWILLGDEAAPQTAVRFDSREGVTPPSLEIEYVPEPTAAVSTAAALLALAFLRRRHSSPRRGSDSRR